MKSVRSLLTSLAIVPVFLCSATARSIRLPARSTDDDLDRIIKDSPLLSLHRSLCAIESISSSEQTVGKFLVEYLESKDFTVEKQEVPFDEESDGDAENPRLNIFAYPAGSTSAAEIVLTTHMDTVPPHIPYTPTANETRKDILISGRGTVDSKASIAAQAIAALNHLESNPDTALALLFLVSEETSGGGVAFFSDSPLNPDPAPYRAVIFGEPTQGKLSSGHRGMLSFNIDVSGVAAHSGYPWLGKNAVSAALPILSRLDALGSIPEEEGGLPANDKYGNTTINIGTINAGAASNVVPASASAAIAMRLAGGTTADAERIIREAVAKVCTENNIDEKRVKLEFKQNEGYEPIDLDYDVDGFKVDVMHYGTDIPHFKIHGDADVKRYLYGPGSILVAHGTDEGLTIGDLETAVVDYGKIIDAAWRKGSSKLNLLEAISLSLRDFKRTQRIVQSFR